MERRGRRWGWRRWWRGRERLERGRKGKRQLERRR
jgi:hypothetical protein